MTHSIAHFNRNTHRYRCFQAINSWCSLIFFFLHNSQVIYNLFRFGWYLVFTLLEMLFITSVLILFTVSVSEMINNLICLQCCINKTINAWFQLLKKATTHVKTLLFDKVCNKTTNKLRFWFQTLFYCFKVPISDLNQ